MVKLVNRAKMSTVTTGTGTITLGSAVDGFQTFAAAGVANGNTVRYAIEDGNNWEIGTGTYNVSGPTLTRTVSESSNSDVAINLSGTALVFLTVAGEELQHAADMDQGVATTDSPSFAGLTATTATITGGTITGITDLAVADGGTGASTAPVALTNLGLTATAAEINILDGVTATAAEINILDGVTATAAEINILDGVTASTAEINILDGVTASTAELNILDGVTASTAELNKLDGATATTAQLNFVTGVTSAIQTQLGTKAPLASPTFTGTPTAPTQTAGNSSTRLATTAFVTTANNLKANLASPTFTGTVNATTVDTTNLEVTNIKAKDGTASATIANSTGVLTADINGGSIDGTVIGGSTPAAIGGTTGTFSGDVSIADKIVHTGDTNTAIRFPAADTVAIETNGAERLRVTSAGKVGIGTSSPFGQLTLGASGSASLYLEDGASASTSNRYIAFFNDNGLRVQTRTDANTFVSNDYLITTVASGANTHRWQTANTEKMRLSSAGKLLIGTTFTGVSILRLVGLPTSSAGLFSGDVWNDGGTLKIV